MVNRNQKLKTPIVGILSLLILIIPSLLTNDTASALSCAPSAPRIGAVSDIVEQENNFYKILFENVRTFDEKNIRKLANYYFIDEMYEKIVEDYIKGEELSKIGDWWKSQNTILIRSATFEKIKLQKGDIIIEGPPFGVCNSPGFTGIFSSTGNLKYAIIEDDFNDYSYRGIAINVEPGKEIECLYGYCKVQVNYQVGSEKFTLSLKDSYSLNTEYFNSFTLLDSSYEQKGQEGEEIIDDILGIMGPHVSYIIAFNINEQKANLVITIPTTFTLEEGQTALVSNYQDMKITLTKLITNPKCTGSNCPLSLAYIREKAVVTVSTPGGCGPNADPRCLGPPGYNNEFTISEGESIDILGVRLSLGKISDNNKAAKFTIDFRSNENICPTLVPPSPDACPNGKWVYRGLDVNGCQRAPVCKNTTYMPSEFLPIEIKIPTSFSLRQPQAAYITNYEDIGAIVLRKIITNPPCTSESCPKSDVQERVEVTIAGNPCYPTIPADRCAVTMEIRPEPVYTIFVGDTLEVFGVKLKLLDIYYEGHTKSIPPQPVGKPIARFDISFTGEQKYCPEFKQPLCGEDGKTYSNSCELENAGQQASCDGTCPCPTNRIDLSLGYDQTTTTTLNGKQYTLKALASLFEPPDLDKVNLPRPPLEVDPDASPFVPKFPPTEVGPPIKDSRSPYIPTLGFVGGKFTPPLGQKLDPELERLARDRLKTIGPAAVVYAFILVDPDTTAEELTALSKSGVELLGYHPNGYKAKINANQLSAVVALPFVIWVGNPDSRLKLEPSLHFAIFGTTYTPGGTRQFVTPPSDQVYISLFESDQTGEFRKSLEEAGAKVDDYYPELSEYFATANLDAIQRTAKLDFVLYIEPYIEATAYSATGAVVGESSGSAEVSIVTIEPTARVKIDMRPKSIVRITTQSGQEFTTTLLAKYQSQTFTLEERTLKVFIKDISPNAQGKIITSFAIFDLTGEIIPPPEDQTCENGCLSGGVCFNYGIRIEKQGQNLYCDFTGEFIQQKQIGGSCQNDFECQTNTCSNNICYDIQRELRETRGLLDRILDWLRRIF